MIIELPIHHVLPDILEKLGTLRNLVLQADPGAGKSTVVPLALLKSAYLQNKKIIMLEPRRMAARALANYMAAHLGQRVGETVGYQVKDDKKLSANTRLEIITEGILIKRLVSNPELDNVGLIIFDEFHERSINADLSLMLALEIQQCLREDLRLLIMSATLDTSLIARYLDDAPVLLCKGRSYPVDISYRKTVKYQLAQTVCHALQDVIDISGDVLIFLPGMADINKCLSLVKQKFASSLNLSFLPLHGSLPLEEQERALRASPDGFKKIIFSTNIAETSLTIEGVTCVIDSGLEKILTFTPSSGMSNLKTTRISKASAQQRTGRAGRLSAGSCIRLWSQSEHASLKSYQQEEILNADLAAMVLELARSGHVKYENINWLTPPPKAHFDSAQDLLKRLELLEPSGKISTIGEKASQLPVHPRLAKMMLSAQDAQERELACIISAILSHQDLLRKADSVDLLMRIFLVIEGNQNNLKNKPYMFRALSKDIVRLKAALKHQSVTVSPATINNVVAYLVLQAFPERLAKKRSASSNTYQLANGKGVFLDKSDPLSNDQFLVVNDCDADQKDGRIYSAVCFDINILYERYADKIEEIQEYKLSTKTNEVYVSKLTKYGSILLAQRRSDDVPKKFLFDSIKSLLKEDAKRIVDWTWQCEEWLKRVVWLGGKVTGFPILTQASIMDTADEWLLPYLSNTKKVSDLKRVKIFPFLTSLLTYEESKILEQEAPVTYTTPNNKKITINYDKHQGPTVCVVLQEVFGEKASPRLGGGTVALRFELLSPAKRPIQITSDLANFWTGSYFDVAKEMRAKYPKHRWPVDPLCEEAGTSIKKR